MGACVLGRRSVRSNQWPFLAVLWLSGGCSEGEYCDRALSCEDASVAAHADAPATGVQSGADASRHTNGTTTAADEAEYGDVTGQGGEGGGSTVSGTITPMVSAGGGDTPAGEDAALPKGGDASVTDPHAVDASLPVSQDASMNDSPAVSVARCGDGMVDKGEQCDDGNAESDDGCSLACVVESGYACDEPAAACHEVVCGDGLRDDGEACDDENVEDDDGCDYKCAVESGFACPEVGQQCVDIRACGNGTVEGDEECDLGADNDDQGGCTSLCRQPRCGDGIQQSGEQCDDGDLSGAYGKCDEGCVDAPRCGDGQVQASVEECDLGAGNDGTGACAEDCTLTHFCGNGVVESDLGEQCEGDVSPVGDQPGCADCQKACGGTAIVCEGKCIDPAADAMHCGASADCQGDSSGAICIRHCVDSECADIWSEPQALDESLAYQPQMHFLDDSKALIVWYRAEDEMAISLYEVALGQSSEPVVHPFALTSSDDGPILASAASGGRGYVAWVAYENGVASRQSWMATVDPQGWSEPFELSDGDNPGLALGARGEWASVGYRDDRLQAATKTIKANGGTWSSPLAMVNHQIPQGLSKVYVSPAGRAWFHNDASNVLVELEEDGFANRAATSPFPGLDGDRTECRFGLAGEVGLMVWYQKADEDGVDPAYLSARSTGGSFESYSFLPAPPDQHLRLAIELVGGSENSAALLWGVYDSPTLANPDAPEVGSLWLSHYDGEWGAPEQIVDMTDGVIFDSSNSDIAMNDAGQIIVAWATGSETWMRYYDGAQWEDPQQFDRPLPGATVSVAISPNGTALVATGDPAVWVSVLR